MPWQELIEAKVEGKESPASAEEGGRGAREVFDLMEALNVSVQRAKESRGEDAGDTTVHEMKPQEHQSQGCSPAMKHRWIL